jgi:hypothetical protein
VFLEIEAQRFHGDRATGNSRSVTPGRTELETTANFDPLVLASDIEAQGLDQRRDRAAITRHLELASRTRALPGPSRLQHLGGAGGPIPEPQFAGAILRLRQCFAAPGRIIVLQPHERFSRCRYSPRNSRCRCARCKFPREVSKFSSRADRLPQSRRTLILFPFACGEARRWRAAGAPWD